MTKPEQTTIDRFPQAFFKGEIVPIEEANLSIMTNALQYGTGVFGGIRGYWDENKTEISIFRLQDHFERFLSSLKILGTSLEYSVDELTQVTLELVERNQPQQDCYLRPFAYAARLGLSPNLAKDPVFAFAMYMIPLNEYLPVDKGLNVGVSSWQRVSDNIIPARGKISGAYVNSALARKEASDHGYDEAIFLTHTGHVSEGSAENIFIVRNGALVTPPLGDDVLEGVTRRTIIQLAKDLKVEVQERSVDRTELYICQEAFFSGTGCQLAWIASVDKRPVGNGKQGPVTQKLSALFYQVVKGQAQKYESWYTKVAIKT
jgi:branched-chain amino acid aminotransferase